MSNSINKRLQKLMRIREIENDRVKGPFVPASAVEKQLEMILYAHKNNKMSLTDAVKMIKDMFVYDQPWK